MPNDDPNNSDLWPPIDESWDRELRVQTGPLREQAPPDQMPEDPDAAGEMPETFTPSTPEPWAPDNLKASHIVGTGDCYLGEIGYSYDAAVDSVKAQLGIIDVRRVQPWTDGDGVLTLGEIPPPLSSPNLALIQATPFPCVDQAAYFGKPGEPVLVLTGRDGRAYYLPDTAPFIGVLQSRGSTKEANFGGSGNQTITVVRRIMSGDPTSQAPTFTDTDPVVEYQYVYPIVPAGQHHGHRVGDTVLCFRRGMYIFCLPARAVWHGKIAATGPASEADFDDERYWVEILTVNIAYTGDTNLWNWKADGAVPAAFPLGKIEAANMAEITAETHSVAAGTEVLVTLMADTTGTARPYFVFTHSNTSVKWGVPKIDPGTTDVGTILLVPCTKAGVATGDADVRVFIRDDRSTVQLSARGWKATVAAVGETPAVIGTILSYMPLAETVTVTEGTVGGVLIGEGPGGPAVEWGHPSSASNTGSVSTIALVTCDKNGTTLAEDITVYLRNDQSAVDITARAWTQSTLLSFVRSVKNTAGVGGVLIGESRPCESTIYYSAVDELPANWECFTVLYVFDGCGKCVGWYYADGCGRYLWETKWDVADPGIL